MDKIVIKLTSRSETGKAAQKVRDIGEIPAVLYGHGVEATNVKLNLKEFEKAYAQAGTNKIVGLKIDDNRQKSGLIHDIQNHPLTGAPIHVDLYVVRMDEKIKTEVPIHFTGESTAVYQQEGTLVKNLETIEIEALPSDLPDSFEVDISVLDDFEKEIRVSDLKIPEGVTLLTEEAELIAKVDPPRSDEEMAELDEEIVEELPEGVEEEQIAVKEENEGDKDKEPKPTE